MCAFWLSFGCNNLMSDTHVSGLHMICIWICFCFKLCFVDRCLDNGNAHASDFLLTSAAISGFSDFVTLFTAIVGRKMQSRRRKRSTWLTWPKPTEKPIDRFLRQFMSLYRANIYTRPFSFLRCLSLIG